MFIDFYSNPSFYIFIHSFIFVIDFFIFFLFLLPGEGTCIRMKIKFRFVQVFISPGVYPTLQERYVYTESLTTERRHSCQFSGLNIPPEKNFKLNLYYYKPVKCSFT